MLTFSQIISKEVVSVYECESLGIIKNVVLNDQLTKVVKFVYFNDESDHDFSVKMSNVYALSKDGILIKNATKIDLHDGQDTTIMNKRVFDLAAVDHGKICDVEFDQSGKVFNIITTLGKTFAKTDIVKMGAICLIKCEGKNAKALSTNFRPKNSFENEKLANKIEVKIVSMQQEQTQSQNTSFAVLPPKILPSASTLIGRKSAKTILGFNNKVIIKQYGVITKQTLDMAKLHNKTSELMLNVL